MESAWGFRWKIVGQEVFTLEKYSRLPDGTSMGNSASESPVIVLAKAIELLLREDELLGSVERALGLIGESAQQDRAYLFEVFADSESGRLLMSQRCEWASEDVTPQIDNPELMNADISAVIPRWLEAFQKRVIIEGAVRTFPQSERDILEPQGILSLLCVPVFHEEQLCAFIGFDNCHEECEWTEEDKALLRTIATAIGAALGRKEYVRKLKEGEERFRKLINGNPTVAVQGFYEDGRITYWNRASETLYGHQAEDVIGKDIFELVAAAENRDRIRTLFGMMKDQKEEDRQAVQATYLHKDGHEIPVLTCLRPLDRPGQQTEYFAFDIDLTEQKQLEAQLLRNQRLEAIGSLASGIAHDLNNVLATMLMCMDSMKTQASLPEDLIPFLNIMEQSTTRAVDMSRKLLSFAKGSTVKAVEVDLNRLVKELIDMLSTTLPKHIRITCDLPEDLPVIQGDPTQIHQILMNLALNARDAMPDGGELCFKGDLSTLMATPAGAMGENFVPGPHVVLGVTDNGEGMAQETLLKVFEPFFTTKGHNKGSGLGLSTTLSIVKSHSGWIQPQSQPGTGTTFRIYFPVETAAREGQPDINETDAFPKGNGECVLVIDDEVAIRKVTAELLQNANYQTLQAENGEEGRKLFQAHPEIRLVITDLMMPVMDGVTAMKHFRDLRPDIPLIATSGMVSAQVDKEEARELSDTFLAKPYRSAELLQAVGQLLA
jgi:PAS domain S-box-containing protein